MPNKKPAKTNQDDVDALTVRVDTMMSTEQHSEPQRQAGEPVVGNTPKAPVAIASAPQVPAALLKKLPAEKTTATPIAAKKIAPATAVPATDTPIEVPGLPSQIGPEPKDMLESPETDRAVDDIVAHEADTLLALEDARNNAKKPIARKSFKDRLRAGLTAKKVIVILPILLIALLALPTTRYVLLGAVIKKTITVQVVDSKTGNPVSNAQIKLSDGKAVNTNAEGQAKLKAGVGQRTFEAQKQYYKSQKLNYFVGFASAAQPKFRLDATGRLVPVSVRNKITGKPVAGVRLSILNTTAKTNAKGIAVIALPAKAPQYQARLTFAGYDELVQEIQVTDQAVKANELSLTPSGHIYFLSNAAGSIDVVRANLDGSGRKTVMAGTGKETAATTSLLASRDWRYVVLKARRDTAQPALYLIDTATDKVTEFDTSGTELTLIGWYNHAFVYKQERTDKPYYQSGRQLLKSYDADHLQLNQLDQTQAEGDSNGYTYQDIQNLYLVDGVLAYTVQWNRYIADESALNGKNDVIRTIQPNGQAKKDVRSLPSSSVASIRATLALPQSLYVAVQANSDGSIKYYELEDGSLKDEAMTQAEFDKAYPTYLLSPNGNKTFWTELRDGRKTAFTGAANADNQKPLANLTGYTPYGWYGNDYLLASKNDSELYIVPTQGSVPPLKVTDYYKPAQNYEGYGYGYGGL